MSVFENIQKYAKLKGWNLQTTAEKAGLSRNVIYQYNKGKNPSLETLGKIANVLGVQTDVLLDSGKKSDIKKPATVDIADDDVIMTYEGRPIPKEDLEYIKRILDGGK